MALAHARMDIDAMADEMDGDLTPFMDLFEAKP